MALWDNTAKSLVTSVKHQYWAEDKKLGEGVESGTMGGPRGVCRGTNAGAARGLPGQAPRRGPMQQAQGMNCDRAALSTRAQALGEFGPAWFMPGLLPSMCIKPGESSEAVPGAGSCSVGCWWQLLVSVPRAVTCVSLALSGSGSQAPQDVLAVAWYHGTVGNQTALSVAALSSPSSSQCKQKMTSKYNKMPTAEPSGAGSHSEIAPGCPDTCSPHHPMASPPSSLHSTHHSCLNQGLQGWCPGL